ncbi:MULTISPECIES: DNA polymerase Y family protein [unclassified Brevundimonas]|uniref:Y-family DNA polymerase n=1 Tax=unclassified Brevundimonas TaxID=2622653 RepID=UPI001E33424B|nr:MULTISPECIES: DNA polymerase Y family protein [unclassified Brevundimonas]
MNSEPSARPRRYLAVWFPWLPSDRLRRQERDAPPDGAPPVVLVEKVKGALRLAAVDPTAAQAGLTSGLTLADARARTPALRTVAHRPDADDALLAQVLEDFGRFTPMIALDPPHGLMLDVTGCAHLFGGEVGLIQTVQTRAERAGLQTRSTLAATPQVARALTRFGPGGLFAPGQDRAAARALPVAALELSDKEEQALRRAGLKRLADLDDRPRAPLAARFGADFPARLARVLGDEDVRITPHRPPAPVVLDRVFFEPVSAPEDIERVLTDLLIETMDRLDQAGQGGRAFEAGFYRVDGEVRRVVVRTGRPTRDAPAVLRLFRERVAALSNPLDPGFGFDQMRMSVPWTQILSPTQQGLEREMPGEEAFSRLIDRLTARLGPEAVLRFEPFASHIPERAARLVPASMRPNGEVWPDLDPDDPPLRPLQMFDPPQPVETLAEVPDGYPLKFRWRRVLHEVTRAEGPERINGEWWRAPNQRTRDYYRVEDRDGRRFWLFRQGLYGETPEPRWFIHGLFA